MVTRSRSPKVHAPVHATAKRKDILIHRPHDDDSSFSSSSESLLALLVLVGMFRRPQRPHHLLQPQQPPLSRHSFTCFFSLCSFVSLTSVMMAGGTGAWEAESMGIGVGALAADGACAA